MSSRPKTDWQAFSLIHEAFSVGYPRCARVRFIHGPCRSHETSRHCRNKGHEKAFDPGVNLTHTPRQKTRRKLIVWREIDIQTILKSQPRKHVPPVSIDFNEAFRNAEEIEPLLGVPTIGFIPTIEEPGLRLIRDTSAFSPLMESFRGLRTNIHFLTEPSMRSLMITSSVPAEGKSSLLSNLAMSMSMMLENNRVIVVDSDLRRPTLHKIFNVDASPGLTDVLAGTHSVAQVVRPTSVRNIRIVTAGAPPMNPTELLASAAMGRFLYEAETMSDIVLLDSPPTLAVADAMVLAPRTDGVLMVIGFGETKKDSVKKTFDLLAGRAKANVIGTAINRVSGPSSGYYYGKYYVPADPTPKDGSVEGADSPPVATLRRRKPRSKQR